jgi:single-stranded DNA-binding protein
MTVHVLITGTLFRPAEQKTSQAGKRYVTATMKAASTDASNSEFWSVLAFSDTAQAELLRLGAGEKLSVQGGLKLETYAANNGETRISRTVFADAILPLRAAPKEKKAKATVTAPAGRPPLERVNILPDRSSDLDDDVPF